MLSTLFWWSSLLPEENIKKGDYLRPTRLRRSSADRHTCSSGQHALTGVEIASTVCLPTSGALVGADGFLRLRFFRLFFLDYFDATGHYNGTINYKLTGSTHNPKDAVQIRFAAWERRGLSSNKGKHRCDEGVSSSVMIFGTIDFFARIYSNNQPIWFISKGFGSI